MTSRLLFGATSEDVDESLGPGRFGMAEETGVGPNEAIRTGAEAGAASDRASAITWRVAIPRMRQA